MSDFKDMLTQAFLGEEPFEPQHGRAELEESVRRFERRDRTARILAWLAVTFGSAVMASGVWGLWHADAGTSAKLLIVYAILVIFGGIQVGFMKMWLFRFQDHLSVMKEIKGTQMMLLDLLGPGPDRG